jgi:site-specific recombinase XerD
MTYFEQFEKCLKDGNKSRHTIKSYLSDLRQYEKWLKGTYGEVELSPNVITTLDVAHYKTFMLNNQQRKPAGINRALSSISAFCDWAISQRLIAENPVKDIPQAKQIKTPPKSLFENELNKLNREVYKAGNKRDIAMVELMAGAGLRISEVESLTIHDIEVSERKGVVTVRHGKGSKYRQIPLNKDIRKAIQEYLQVRPNEGGALFISQKGGGLASNAIWKIVKKYADRAGMADITPHSLRHTFGTMLIRKHKVDIMTTAALMGHENISTTAIYTKPNQQDMIEAVEKLSKW